MSLLNIPMDDGATTSEAGCDSTRGSGGQTPVETERPLRMDETCVSGLALRSPGLAGRYLQSTSERWQRAHCRGGTPSQAILADVHRRLGMSIGLRSTGDSPRR